MYQVSVLGVERRLVRHNGVIIEPSGEGEKEKEGEEGGSSGSKAGSRSTSPISKGKGKGRGKKNATPSALATPGTAGPSSGNNYYRSHTMGHLQNGTSLPILLTRPMLMRYHRYYVRSSAIHRQ